MAKRKQESKRPQPNHKVSKKSQHDRLDRLGLANPSRRMTEVATIPLTGMLSVMAASMSGQLDQRMGFRLTIILAGMMLATGRRTASSWFVAAGVRDDWDRFYDCLGSVGRYIKKLAVVVLVLVLKTVVLKATGGVPAHVLLGIDDTPTARHGRHVEGAGVHHHPTPGPADGEWLYGHNWVSMALLAQHSLWGVIALPLMSLLYVRKIDVPNLAEKYDWTFRTKHELAVELVEWFLKTIETLELTCRVWVAVDGAYAARPFLVPLCKQGVIVVSRLRRDAVLFNLPPKPKPGQRGRPRKYGDRLSLAKRAAHRDGWEMMTYLCRGSEVTRQVKSFTAVSELTGGLIRVVIVRFEDGNWAPYFCTDDTVGVREILEAVAARWALEEHFHDVKEVWGAGQQQVRNVWSNIGCWHLNQWMFTLVELCSWDREKSELTDRADRPWDNTSRRPSHADRRRTIAREMLQNQFPRLETSTPESIKYQALVTALFNLCT